MSLAESLESSSYQDSGVTFGDHYEAAKAGRRCWIRHDDGQRRALPIQRWLGASGAVDDFDSAVIDSCRPAVIELCCGPARLVAHLARRQVSAIGVDSSATAVRLARRNGAAAVCRDVHGPLPGIGDWRTALLIDDTVGLGGDPTRMLRRAAQLLRRDGRCIVEFDTTVDGLREHTVRLESSGGIGPWFPWHAVGVDYGVELCEEVGLGAPQITVVDGRTLVVATKC